MARREHPDHQAGFHGIAGRRASARMKAIGPAATPGPDERGMALIFALLSMGVLIIMVAAFMIAVNVGTNVGGRSVRTAKALNLAEAGVAEAMQRIRAGDVPDNGNPRLVTQIFLTTPGSVPALGADSIGLATGQPANDWLPYSTAGRDERALTIRYKTDGAQSVIYRYDALKYPSIQTVSGTPIYVIESTGRKGTSARKVVTEVYKVPINVSVRSAIAADVNIQFKGNSSVCGYNHQAETPGGTRDRGPCLAYELGSGHLPGAWTTGSATSTGSSEQFGSPAIQDHQTGFYAGPWEALSLTQANFYSWIGPGLTSEPSIPKGIIHLDNNGTAQDQSGSFAYNGGDGEGLLYVDGDLTINGNFTYRGLIYVEGDLKVNGGAWVLGAVIAKGKTVIKHANGDACILFSEDAIKQNIAKYGGEVETLSWREI